MSAYPHVNVYAYYDANGLRHIADEDDVYMAGAWNSSTAYIATDKPVVDFGLTKYIAIVDNTNWSPATPVTVFTPRKWSVFTLIIEETGTSPTETSLAQQAYDLAVWGTYLGSLAYELAGSGSNLAWQASLTPNYASGGTMTGALVVPNVVVGVGSYSYYDSVFDGTVATMAYSFTGPAYQMTTVNGDFVVSTKDHRAGAEITVALLPDGVAHPLSYAGSTVTWFGTAAPTEIYNKKIAFALTCLQDSPVAIWGAAATEV